MTVVILDGNKKTGHSGEKKLQLSLEETKGKLRIYKRGRGRKRRATEIAPAGAVCWEQVVYLGQHIASSAFLPTRLSKRRRGQTCETSCIINRLCLRAPHMQHMQRMQPLIPTVRWLSAAFPCRKHRREHTCRPSARL